MIAEDVRGILAGLGATSLDEIIGRADLLTSDDSAVGSDLARVLVRADSGEELRFRTLPSSPLGDQLARVGRSVLSGEGSRAVSYPIRNTDRAVGTRLSGEIAARTGDTGLAEGSLAVRLSGSGGQSFGAFLSNGIDLEIDGVANDGVGKGMAGGTIVIRPFTASSVVPHGAGNACLYGATGGRLFVSGGVGQRFAVRNSGAVAVIERASDHLAEYMTGGTVVVLGGTGRNVGAGMTGGTVFLYDEPGSAPIHMSEGATPVRRLTDSEATELMELVTEHHDRTRSVLAEDMLKDWDTASARFWIVKP
jgi:glutamate synthase domain-containing protein 3